MKWPNKPMVPTAPTSPTINSLYPLRRHIGQPLGSGGNELRAANNGPQITRREIAGTRGVAGHEK